MTDRELLELAAKAAGLPWDQWVEDGDDSWNSLEDDGDALRLAAKMNLSICYTLGDMNAQWGTAMAGFSPWDNANPIAAVRYQSHEEKMAATRRAITRAAAQIQLDKEKQ